MMVRFTALEELLIAKGCLSRSDLHEVTKRLLDQSMAEIRKSQIDDIEKQLWLSLNAPPYGRFQ